MHRETRPYTDVANWVKKDGYQTVYLNLRYQLSPKCILGKSKPKVWMHYLQLLLVEMN